MSTTRSFEAATALSGTSELGHALSTALKHAWWWLRQVSGDADYENYVRRVLSTSGASSPSCEDMDSSIRSCGTPSCGIASPEQFYLDRLRRQHSKINRCC